MAISIKDYLSYIIGLLGVFVGALGVYFTYHFGHGTPIKELFHLTSIIFITAFVIIAIILVISIWRYIVYKRYALAYSILNEAFKTCHEVLLEKQYEDDFKKSIDAFSRFCSKVKEAFVKISGSNCSVCIKLFEKYENNACLVTLCRDLGAIEDNSRINPDDDEPQKIDENTDFKNIFEKATDKPERQHKYFFSNKLPNEYDYLNSRLDPSILKSKRDIPIWRTLSRYWKWDLPYKSTIVVPITPLSSQSLEENKIEGFLCLDSKSLFAFKKKFDIDIMMGIADGLYPTLKAFNEHYQTEAKE